MIEPNAALTNFGYAFTLAGTIATTATFVYYAAERKPLALYDRAMCGVLIAVLTALALSAVIAHDYGRALIIALVLALFGAAARAAVARSAREERASEARAPGPRGEGASPYGRRWRRTRRPRPYH